MATHDARSCVEGLKAAVELYRELREAPVFRPVSRNAPAEGIAIDFIQTVEQLMLP